MMVKARGTFWIYLSHSLVCIARCCEVPSECVTMAQFCEAVNLGCVVQIQLGALSAHELMLFHPVSRYSLVVRFTVGAS